MPSTTTPAADGLRPIGAEMPAAVRAIADAAIQRRGGALDHPNRVEMRAFIARAIQKARSLGGEPGAEALSPYIRQVHENRRNLTDWADDRPGVRLIAGLEGLTIFDIDDAQFQLESVQRELRKAVSA